MILKVRTGWDRKGYELFDTIANVEAVEDRGEYDPFTATDEPICYMSMHDMRNGSHTVAALHPRLLNVRRGTGPRMIYAVLDAYLCNDEGRTLAHYQCEWKAGEPQTPESD